MLNQKRSLFFSISLFAACTFLTSFSNPSYSNTTKKARCLFIVDNKTYINGDCDFAFSGGDGSFSFNDNKIRLGCHVYDIGPNDCSGAATKVIRNGTFGYLSMQGNTYNGDGKGRPVISWNNGNNRRAIFSLGPVSLQNGCWRNSRVKACFYAK